MRHYETLELKVLFLEDEDVLTASADFVDKNEGYNGVWFPGSQGGTSQWENN